MYEMTEAEVSEVRDNVHRFDGLREDELRRMQHREVMQTRWAVEDFSRDERMVALWCAMGIDILTDHEAFAYPVERYKVKTMDALRAHFEEYIADEDSSLRPGNGYDEEIANARAFLELSPFRLWQIKKQLDDATDEMLRDLMPGLVSGSDSFNLENFVQQKWAELILAWAESRSAE